MNSLRTALLGLVVAVVVVTGRHNQGLNGQLCLRQGDKVVFHHDGLTCLCQPTNQKFLGITILRWNCTQNTTTTTTTMVPTMVPTTGLPVAPTTTGLPVAPTTGLPVAPTTMAPTPTPPPRPTQPQP